MIYYRQNKTYKSASKHLTLTADVLKIVRTKISRAAFIAGLALMGLMCCSTDAVPLRHMVITGIAGAVLTLTSMRWTGWGDW